MLNTIISILCLIGMSVFCAITFILANIDRILKEDADMENIIEVTPNKDGKIFITLYGTRYQIVVKNTDLNSEELPSHTHSLTECKPAKTSKTEK